ncbi:hypothetical protein ACFQ5J_01860 [Lacticaseibacillus baoqingensis]|uniref:Glycosyltransferase family 2 protein n=1 Tax=Lacticaseibacillus baoqingensis TaxID=2486013 RepID=A0ABW4E278_9LACO|nr:hypothetical protein [Lacticaseibacillus baoqingensis]
MQKQTFGIVVVAYQPDRAAFLTKLQAWAQVCDHIVVANNGDALTIDLPQVRVLALGGNQGIAAAHNAGIAALAAAGVAQAFLMDQDSSADGDFFTAMWAQWQTLQPQVPHLGMLSPLIRDVHLQKRLPLFQIKDHAITTVHPQPASAGYLTETLPIASGCLVALQAFEAVKGEKADWFIDWVDFEFALALRQCGWAVITTTAVEMAHQIGRTEPRHFLGKTIYPSNAPVFRDYYYVRNGLKLARAYGQEITGLKRFVYKKIANRFLFAFYEDQPFKRLGRLISGVFSSK